jgi:hypothetical protein
MASLHDEWKVFPHGPVEQIDEGIVSVEGEIQMPLGRFPRRMTIVALNDGRTVAFSPVALDEPAIREVEALGALAFMVVPNGFHRLDARPFKKRYPEIRVVCPPGAKNRVEKAVPVDAVSDVFKDGEVRFIVVEGMRNAEAALIVRRGSGTTLILNDVISNVRHPKGLGANIMARLFRFGIKRPQMSREVRYLFVSDKRALAKQIRDWAAIPDLRRVIVSHGEIIDQSPAEVLQSIAATLD